MPDADPPPTPAEEALAAAVDAALERLLKGDAAPPGPEVAELVRAAQLVWRFADSVREHAAGGSGDTADWAAPDADTVPDPFPGEYRLRSVLGRGGFGTVWLADDLNLGVPVALKTLRIADPARLDALRQEARALAGVRHPNVVRVHAWRQAGGEHYLVMQYVPGGSFADKLTRAGPLPWAAAARYAADVGDALVAVHAAGLAHRDVKPANVLWDSDADEALLTDFGLTARLGQAVGSAGTPRFMPPEAFAGHVSPAGDVYGLAATLFALATGEPPFPAGHWEGGSAAPGLPDPDPRLAGVPDGIERAVRAGLAADPARRPAPAAFVAALRGALNQSLADALPPAAPSGCAVHLLVSRWDGTGYTPVTATRPPRAVATRDLKRVPAAPARVGLRTGDRVRLQAVADRPGFLTVFNVGPTGNLNLLFPDGPTAAAVEAGRPVDILDVELTPPAGPERVFAVWTRTPLAWSATQLQAVAARDVSVSYRATRDMQVLKDAVGRLPAGEWHAVVLDLDHQPA